MLTITMQSNNILQVEEVVESACVSSRAMVHYWYYDTVNWKVSSHGKEGDTPDRDMTPSAIEWVKKHYLPYVENKLI